MAGLPLSGLMGAIIGFIVGLLTCFSSQSDGLCLTFFVTPCDYIHYSLGCKRIRTCFQVIGAAKLLQKRAREALDRRRIKPFAGFGGVLKKDIEYIPPADAFACP